MSVVLPGSGGGLKETVARVVRDAEVRLIRRAVAQAGNKRTEAARLLGISRRASSPS